MACGGGGGRSAVFPSWLRGAKRCYAGALKDDRAGGPASSLFSDAATGRSGWGGPRGSASGPEGWVRQQGGTDLPPLPAQAFLRAGPYRFCCPSLGAPAQCSLLLAWPPSFIRPQLPAASVLTRPIPCMEGQALTSSLLWPLAGVHILSVAQSQRDIGFPGRCLESHSYNSEVQPNIK